MESTYNKYPLASVDGPLFNEICIFLLLSMYPHADKRHTRAKTKRKKYMVLGICLRLMLGTWHTTWYQGVGCILCRRILDVCLLFSACGQRLNNPPAVCVDGDGDAVCCSCCCWGFMVGFAVAVVLWPF